MHLSIGTVILIHFLSSGAVAMVVVVAQSTSEEQSKNVLTRTFSWTWIWWTALRDGETHKRVPGGSKWIQTGKDLANLVTSHCRMLSLSMLHQPNWCCLLPPVWPLSVDLCLFRRWGLLVLVPLNLTPLPLPYHHGWPYRSWSSRLLSSWNHWDRQALCHNKKDHKPIKVSDASLLTTTDCEHTKHAKIHWIDPF